jgi:uroporphyrinogen-III synthase
MQRKTRDTPLPFLPRGEGGAPEGATDEGNITKAKARLAREASPQSLPRRRGDACARVALFRAREDANASAARLRRYGFSVACLPVIEIRTSPVRPQRSHYDAVVATSDKAFHADGPSGTSSPLYVVGARTGRAAEARGWRLASPPARNANELLTTLVGALKPESHVLYLAGRDRKEAVEAALSETFEFEVAEAYAAEAREAWRPSEARALAPCVGALHYSRRSAGLAAGLAKIAGVEDCFLRLKHICISRDAAEPLQMIGATHIEIAETPDEAGLFRSVRQELGGFPSLGSSRI